MMPDDAKNQVDSISHCFKFSVTTNLLLPVPKVSHSHCPLSPLTTPEFMFFPTVSRYNFYYTSIFIFEFSISFVHLFIC